MVQFDFSAAALNRKRLLLKMLLGAATGLIIISLFVFTVDHPNPAWGKYWMVQPLVVTPLTAAFASLVFYLPEFLQFNSTWKNTLVRLTSILLFIIMLYMGIILGLNGTLWN